MSKMKKTRIDIFLALVAIAGIALGLWLDGLMPPLVAGSLMGLSFYVWMRLPDGK